MLYYYFYLFIFLAPKASGVAECDRAEGIKLMQVDAGSAVFIQRVLASWGLSCVPTDRLCKMC